MAGGHHSMTSQVTSAGPQATRLRVPRGTLGLLPFFGFTLVFLGLPLIGILVSSFRVPVAGAPGETAFGLDNFVLSVTGGQGEAILNSIQISFIAAVIGTVCGALLAQAIITLNSERLDGVTKVLATVLANSGGISLAFSFIVVLGTVGILTQALPLEEWGFSLYSAQGLVLMYQYFLIPTMIMLFLPTLQGVKREWKEAAASLGAPAHQFWVRVGLPVVTPALLSGFVLLFGASFATHVSAAALIGGANFPLVTLKIAGLLTGGNSSGQENVAMALSVNMILVAAVTLAISLPLQKRSRRWLSSK